MRPIACHGDVDDRLRVLARPVGRAQGGVMAQGGRPGKQDRGPRPLQPGQLARVVHVYARMDFDPLPSPEQAADVALGEPVRLRLGPRDHA